MNEGTMYLPGIPETEEDAYRRAVAMPLDFKIKRAIGILKMYERAALDMHAEGFYLCFSGGKDSCVIKQLAIEAGVRFSSFYNETTIDPPELVRFIREKHTDVKFCRSEPRGFFDLASEYGLPTPRARWCCETYKEGGGDGWFKIVGVRAPESARRKRLWKEYRLKGNTKFLAPICYWTDGDVWNFIRSRGIPYCELYDQGFARIGCIGCPMGGLKSIECDFARYPRYEAAYKAAAMKYAARRIKRIKDGTYKMFASVKERGNVDTPEAYWFRWRNMINRKHGEEKCRYEEMLEQIGVMSIRELNESYYEGDGIQDSQTSEQTNSEQDQ